MLLPLLFLLLPLAHAGILHVSTKGVDSEGCGAAATPCKSVKFTLEREAAAGDSVNLEEGVYREGGVEMPVPVRLLGAPRATIEGGFEVKCSGVMSFESLHFKVPNAGCVKQL